MSSAFRSTNSLAGIPSIRRTFLLFCLPFTKKTSNRYSPWSSLRTFLLFGFPLTIDRESLTQRAGPWLDGCASSWRAAGRRLQRRLGSRVVCRLARHTTFWVRRIPLLDLLQKLAIDSRSVRIFRRYPRLDVPLDLHGGDGAVIKIDLDLVEP